MKRTISRVSHRIGLFILLTGLALPFAKADTIAPSAVSSVSAAGTTQNTLTRGVYQVEYSAKRHKLYAAVAGDRTDANDHGMLLTIDPATLNITARLPTQARPFGLALDDKRGRLYTSDTLDASISMFDLQHEGRLMASVRLSEKANEDSKYPFRPREIRLDSTHHRLYVSALAEEGRIYVLDSRTLDTVNIFDNVGKKPTGLALDTAQQRLFLSNGDGEIQILSTNDGHLLSRLKVGTLPLNLLFDARTQRLYATDYKDSAVISINVQDSTQPRIVQRIPTEKGPVALLALPHHHLLAVTEHDAGNVALFDLRNGRLVKRIALGDQPNSLAAAPEQSLLFISAKQPRAKDLSTPGPDRIVRVEMAK